MAGLWTSQNEHPSHLKLSSLLVDSRLSHSNIFINCVRQNDKTVFINHSYWRERWEKEDSNLGPSANQPSALPLGQCSSHSTPYSKHLVPKDTQGQSGTHSLHLVAGTLKHSRFLYIFYCNVLLGTATINFLIVWLQLHGIYVFSIPPVVQP